MVIVIVVCHSVLADSLRPYGLRCARLPCPSPFQTLSKLHMNLLKLTSIELVMSSNHLILCHPLLLLPLIFPSIRVFSNELALCIRWPEYWNFSFSISPSNEYSARSPRILTASFSFFLCFMGHCLKYYFLISFCSTSLFRVFSNTTVQKHQLFNDQPSLLSNSHIQLLEKP